MLSRQNLLVRTWKKKKIDTANRKIFAFVTLHWCRLMSRIPMLFLFFFFFKLWPIKIQCALFYLVANYKTRLGICVYKRKLLKVSGDTMALIRRFLTLTPFSRCCRMWCKSRWHRIFTPFIDKCQPYSHYSQSPTLQLQFTLILNWL